MKNRFEYQDWVLVVDDNESTVEVNKDGETRVYDIKEKILRSEQDDEYPMYVDIFIEGGNYYSFKFEDENALIGDIFNENEEHVESFAQYYFGEEDYEDIKDYDFDDYEFDEFDD
jgi:hypothetical protein